MNRVGLIAYWYPPRQAAGSLRAAALARYLPAFGWEPVVVTVRPRSSLHLPDGVGLVPPRAPALDDAPAPALATADLAWHALAAGAVEAVRTRAPRTGCTGSGSRSPTTPGRGSSIGDPWPASSRPTASRR